MRQTGKTTRMLSKLVLYISENWDRDTKIILTAYSNEYAWQLAKKVAMQFDTFSRTGNSITFGKVKVVVTSLDRVCSSRDFFRGCKWDAEFHDHYIRRIEYDIPI